MGIFYRNQPVYEYNLENIKFESFTEAIGAIISVDSIVKVFSFIVRAVDKQIQKIVKAIRGFIEELRSKTRMKTFQKKRAAAREKSVQDGLLTAEGIKASISKLETERQMQVDKMPTLTPPDKSEYFVADFESTADVLVNEIVHIENDLESYLDSLLSSNRHSFSNGQSLSDSLDYFYGGLNVDQSEGPSVAIRKIIDTSQILFDFADSDIIEESKYHEVLEKTRQKCNRGCTTIVESLDKIPKRLKKKFDGIIRDMRHESEDVVSNFDIAGVQKSVADFTAFVTNMSTSFVSAARQDTLNFSGGLLLIYSYSVDKLEMKQIEKNIGEIDDEIRKLKRQLTAFENPTVESYKIFQLERSV